MMLARHGILVGSAIRSPRLSRCCERLGECKRLTGDLSKRSSAEQAPSSFSHDRMANDTRYQGRSEIPDALLGSDPNVADEKFSIGGKFKEGRAAYLDLSSTTPLDPRVLDAMAPYMVRLDSF